MFHWYYVLSNSNSVAWPQGCNKLLLLLLLLSTAWRAVNASRFPVLALEAKRYLSALPASVASKRLFSSRHKYNTDRRSRLVPKLHLFNDQTTNLYHRLAPCIVYLIVNGIHSILSLCSPVLTIVCHIARLKRKCTTTRRHGRHPRANDYVISTSHMHPNRHSVVRRDD